MERHADREELRSETAFAELLSRSPPRPLPPREDEAMIRRAVHAEWRKVAGGRLLRRRLASFALAASVLLAIFVALNPGRDPLVDFAAQPIAAIDKQIGAIAINSQLVQAGQAVSIAGGDKVDTGAGSGLALAWHDGGSLRVDENTSLVFEAQNQVYLREGRIYFDSKNSPLAPRSAGSGPARIAIRTDHGMLRHLGTQYMARVDGGELVISVREGAVAIDGNVTARAIAGQQFVVSASGELSIAATNGVDDWEWVERCTPAVDLEGRTVAEALAWVGRESGRRIRYASEQAELLANETVLNGFSDLPPSRALAVFMMTVDLHARIDGEVIVISED